jgi:beta-lactam-binding protein with PASTA domain
MALVNDSPRVLGNRYEVGGLLGRGGMAEVHLGRDARLGRAVAIKLLRTDLARDPTFQARFRREAQSAAALNHPAIVAVYDTGEEQVVESGGAVVSLPYIVMEHIEGRTLRDVLAEGHHLDVDAALDIITGVLTALEYSHRIGIVHRDIKPANVMLTPVGDVKVMDFGIARAIADASSTMTQTQAVIGTAQYLSPEQARGEQVDTRSDLYSAGCLLYELLTGRPPFVADSPVAVAYQHVREQPIPPSRLVPGIPDSVDRIVLHSLAKGRDERYQTAADFRADVEAARGGRQVYAVVPQNANQSATTQFIPPTNDMTGTRMAPVAGAYGTDTMGGGTGGAGGPYDPYGQNQEYSRRRQQPEESNQGMLIFAGIALVIVLALVGYFVAKQLSNSGNGGNTTATTLAMPSVVGQKKDDAIKALTDTGFPAANITTKDAASSDVAKGLVSAQSPTPGQVDKTTPISLTISSGPSSVNMPDLVGKSQKKALQLLIDNGITKAPSVKYVDDPTQQPGDVSKTDPTAGNPVAPDDLVTIYLTSEKVAVPKGLIGQTQADAVDTLKQADLNYTINLQPTASADPGTVIKVSPKAGTEVNRGSTVVLTIAEAVTETPTATATTPPATVGPTTPPPTTVTP